HPAGRRGRRRRTAVHRRGPVNPRAGDHRRWRLQPVGMKGKHMDTTADVCVVGAGPAGLTLSLLLVRSGLSTVLVERSGSLARAYRGEIPQPGGQRLLAQLGVLDGARERGSHELTGFQLLDGGRVLLDVDYRRLAPPYDRLLSIPQQHV